MGAIQEKQDFTGLTRAWDILQGEYTGLKTQNNKTYPIVSERSVFMLDGKSEPSCKNPSLLYQKPKGGIIDFNNLPPKPELMFTNSIKEEFYNYVDDYKVYWWSKERRAVGSTLFNCLNQKSCIKGDWQSEIYLTEEGAETHGKKQFEKPEKIWSNEDDFRSKRFVPKGENKDGLITTVTTQSNDGCFVVSGYHSWKEFNEKFKQLD